MLEKTLQSPLDSKAIQPVHPKGNQSWIFIGRTDAEAETLILWPPDVKSWFIWRTDLKLKCQYLAIWWEELTHLKRPWCWERLKFGREVGDSRWDDWVASLTQWTWVWVNSRGCWWTGSPGVLQSMGSQRLRHGWVAELNWSFSWYLVCWLFESLN